ncbi:hypothetical protein AX15_004442 [Amanita polypyramis BW_CC]|nr:hypothetical protein AX15_004442 [Amanita polypyramis BW_CC]
MSYQMSPPSPPPLYPAEIGRTNHGHSDEEERSIRQLLQEKEEELERLTAESLRRQIQLKEEIERYQVALSPHKKLPEEVWRSVFALCCDGYLYPGQRIKAQLTLCAVCSAWRRIVLSMPYLWKDFLVDNPLHLSGTILEAARDWLGRAGDLPMSLTVIRVPTSGCRKEGLTQLLSAYPFRKVHLELDKESLPQIMSALPNTALRYLEDLNLDMVYERLYPGFLAPSPILFHPSARLPNLTSLEIMGACDTQFLSSALTSRHKLRHLALSVRMPARLCFQFLHECSSLEHCHLTVDCEEEDRAFVTSRAFTESHLTSNVSHLRLMFGRENTAVAESFINKLVLPAVCDLTLISADSEATLGCGAAQIAQLAHRSEMKYIEDLCVGNCEGVLEVGILLRSMPSLTRLEVYGEAVFDDQTLRDLATGALGSSLCVFGADNVASDKEKLKETARQRFNTLRRNLALHVRSWDWHV